MTAPASLTDEREQHLDEVVVAYLKAVQQGDAPSRQELLSTHPDLAPELAAFLDDLHHMDQLAAPLRTVAHAAAGPFPGEQIGDYDLLEQIARGGMGVVYKARQISLNRIVAVKMLGLGLLDDDLSRQRFRAEAEAVARMDHPHIVPVYDVGSHDGRPYFSMKLFACALPDYQHNRQQPLSNPDIAALMTDVADAVHYAHQRGVLHRDLKPANILFDRDGRPFVGDFGLAKQFLGEGETSAAAITQSGAVLGTPSYMAPEQATGKTGAVTVATDVYGLGTILYYLLTGQAPFPGDNLLETVRKLEQEEPPRPRTLQPRIDRDLETICLKCLEKNPANRYASARDVAAELTRYRQGESLQARPISVLGRWVRWAKRKPLLAGLMAALVVVVFVGFALVFWQWRRAEANLSHANGLHDLAEERLKDADQQRALAEERYLDAHKIVDRFCLKLSSEELSKIAGLEPLRREMLQEGLKYLKKFVKQRGHDPLLTNELAEAYARVGEITRLIGSQKEALSNYEKARDLFAELHRRYPNKWHVYGNLALMHNFIGSLHREANRFPQALQAYQQAESIAEQLCKKHPNKVRLHTDWAGYLTNLGLVYRTQGLMQKAAAYYEKQYTLIESLVKKHKNNPSVLKERIRGCRQLVHLYTSLGQPDKARPYLQLVCSTSEQMHRADPQDASARRNLAVAFHLLAMDQLAQKQPGASLATMKKARALLEQLTTEHPHSLTFQDDLATCLRDQGHIFRDQKAFDEALTCYSKARDVEAFLVRQNHEVVRHRNNLAKCWFDMGTVQSRTKKLADALESYQQAVRIRRSLVREKSRVPYLHSDLGLSMGNTAIALWNLKRRDEALTSMREAVHHHTWAHSKAPRVSGYRGYLSGALGNLETMARTAGRLEEAASCGMQRAKLWPTDDKELLRAARGLARTATEAGQDQRRTIADAALRLLGQAVDNGFRDGAKLEKDMAFQVLRDRPEFQRLVKQLKRSREVVSPSET